MYCQACHAILPFKVKGDWHFEAIQFIGNRNRTHRQNALALCPLCAAKYKYKLETSDEALLESLSTVSIEAGQGRSSSRSCSMGSWSVSGSLANTPSMCGPLSL